MSSVYETGFVTQAQEDHFREHEPLVYERLINKFGSYRNPKKPRETSDDRYPKPKPFYGRGFL